MRIFPAASTAWTIAPNAARRGPVRSAASLLLPLLLAACVPSASAPVDDPTSYVVTEAPVPFAVTRLLPRGVTVRDVRVDRNCYAYTYQGRIYPVLIPRGTQYCL